MSRKTLQECRTEAERREHWPQLCIIADKIEASPDPLKVLKAVAWIINQRRKEREAGQE